MLWLSFLKLRLCSSEIQFSNKLATYVNKEWWTGCLYKHSRNGCNFLNTVTIISWIIVVLKKKSTAVFCTPSHVNTNHLVFVFNFLGFGLIKLDLKTKSENGLVGRQSMVFQQSFPLSLLVMFFLTVLNWNYRNLYDFLFLYCLGKSSTFTSAFSARRPPQ